MQHHKCLLINVLCKCTYSFPGATNETLLQKFNSVHKESPFYEKPQKKENAFIIKHYAGKVKYQVISLNLYVMHTLHGHVSIDL